MARLVTPSVPIEKSSIIQSQRNFNFSSQNLLPKIDGLNFTRALRKIPLSISRETSEVPINSAPPKAANPIIVIDNYDSFTYNLCQVSFFFVFLLMKSSYTYRCHVCSLFFPLNFEVYGRAGL